MSQKNSKADTVSLRSSLIDDADTNEAIITAATENNTIALRDDCLETENERRSRKISHIIIFLTVFIMAIGFSVVLTGVWPYLKKLDPSASKELLGWVVAANPLGQMIAAPLLGMLSTKMGSNRGAFILTIISFIFGNVLYALLPLFNQNNVRYIMISSRFIVGVSSANIAVCRAYIASSTTLQERTAGISFTAASQSLGFVLGPSIQTVMVYLFDKEEYGESIFVNETLNMTTSLPDNKSLPLFNMYTAACWFVALLGLLNLILYLPCFYKEFNISLLEAKRGSNNQNKLENLKSDYVAVFSILLTFFSILLVFVLLETIIVPMSMDLYGWSPEFTVKVTGIGLTIAGACTIIMFMIGNKLASLTNDRIIYIGLGLIPLVLASLIFLPVGNTYPKIKYCNSSVAENHHRFLSDALNVSDSTRFKRSLSVSSDCDELGCPSNQNWCFNTPIIEIPQFIVGCTMIIMGYAVSVSLSNAIYSKLINPTRQGVWMGILTSVGSSSRVLGPIYVTYMYTAKGPFWIFLSLFVLLLLILILNSFVYKRLKPLSFTKDEQSREQGTTLI